MFYDRYILGLWTVAEGLIFPGFAEDPDKWVLNRSEGGGYALPAWSRLCIGVDFGGNKETLEKFIPAKKANLIDINCQALQTGYDFV